MLNTLLRSTTQRVCTTLAVFLFLAQTFIFQKRKLTMEPLRFLTLWRLLGWFLVLGIIYLSLTPSPLDLKLGLPAQDKLGHFLAYALLAWWFGQIYPSRLQGFWAVFLVFLGISLEIMQDLLGYRHFEYLDMLANTLGVASGYLLVSFTPAGTFLQRLEWR